MLPTSPFLSHSFCRYRQAMLFLWRCNLDKMLPWNPFFNIWKLFDSVTHPSSGMLCPGQGRWVVWGLRSNKLSILRLSKPRISVVCFVIVYVYFSYVIIYAKKNPKNKTLLTGEHLANFVQFRTNQNGTGAFGSRLILAKWVKWFESLQIPINSVCRLQVGQVHTAAANNRFRLVTETLVKIQS